MAWRFCTLIGFESRLYSGFEFDAGGMVDGDVVSAGTPADDKVHTGAYSANQSLAGIDGVPFVVPSYVSLQIGFWIRTAGIYTNTVHYLVRSATGECGIVVRRGSTRTADRVLRLYDALGSSDVALFGTPFGTPDTWMHVGYSLRSGSGGYQAMYLNGTLYALRGASSGPTDFEVDYAAANGMWEHWTDDIFARSSDAGEDMAAPPPFRIQPTTIGGTTTNDWLSSPHQRPGHQAYDGYAVPDTTSMVMTNAAGNRLLHRLRIPPIPTGHKAVGMGSYYYVQRDGTDSGANAVLYGDGSEETVDLDPSVDVWEQKKVHSHDAPSGDPWTEHLLAQAEIGIEST